MLDSPSAPPLRRASEPGGPLPIGIAPSTVTLRDRTTTATILPFSAPNQVPPTLLSYLCSQLGREIEKGNTYPMISPLPLSSFGPYWFGVFGAIMLLGEIADGRELHERAQQGCDWERLCLGSFYIKPNYPGRSSHVCNGGFLVTDASRNRGVGRLMGEAYLDWAPKLGYTYSMFNLVYETNVASCRLWDALGFKRIGRVKGCGDLKSHPGELIDAIIYGRDLGQDDELVSEERFDKIRFYLKTGTYPAGADRAEKSRLRSAATHYKLTPATDAEEEKLWLKGKEVISDVNRQVEIATEVHRASHGGINKTTAAIAEAWHWVRIKETVGKVIRECGECGEMNRGLSAVRSQTRGSASASHSTTAAVGTGTSGQQQYSPPAPASSTGHHAAAGDVSLFPHSQSQSQSQSETSRRHSPPSQPSDDQHLLQPAHSYPSYSNDYPLNINMPIPIPMDIDLPLDPALLHSRVPSPFLSASASSHTHTHTNDRSQHQAPQHPARLPEQTQSHTGGPQRRVQSNRAQGGVKYRDNHVLGPGTRGARAEMRRRMGRVGVGAGDDDETVGVEEGGGGEEGVEEGVQTGVGAGSSGGVRDTVRDSSTATAMRLQYGAFWEGVI